MVAIQILTIPNSWYLFRAWGRSAGECPRRLVQLKQICITKSISSQNKFSSCYILIYRLQDILERKYSIGLDVAIIKTHFSFKKREVVEKNKMHKHYEC